MTSSPFCSTSAVIGYSDTATVLQPLIANETLIRTAIDALDPHGKPNMEQGIRKAEIELDSGGGNKKVMIILAGSKPARKFSTADSCNQLAQSNDNCGAIAAADAAKGDPDLVIFSVGLGVGTVTQDLLQVIRTAPPDDLSDYYYYAPIVSDLLGVYEQVADDICPCDDGVVNGPEECDDSNDVDYDDCTNACANADCGDGIVQIGYEQCDDGNTVSLDGCSYPACLFEASHYCGNFTLEGTERCDDGGTCAGGSNDGNPCARIVVNPNFNCPGGLCNPVADDGCDTNCQPEINIPPFCHTNNEPCFVNDDCMEPDGGSCAVCTNGQCVAGGGTLTRSLHQGVLDVQRWRGVGHQACKHERNGPGNTH